MDGKTTYFAEFWSGNCHYGTRSLRSTERFKAHGEAAMLLRYASPNINMVKVFEQNGTDNYKHVFGLMRWVRDGVLPESATIPPR